MTTIVFIAFSAGNVQGVFEDPMLASARGETVEAWVLDSRDVESATVDEWLTSRRLKTPVYPVPAGTKVYFEDATMRGIGKIIYAPDAPNDLYTISCDANCRFDKINKKVLEDSSNVYVYFDEFKGELEDLK